MNVREGYGSAITPNLKTWLSWLKVNLLRFAIKQMSHQRGSGILPRGTWTRDYAIATRGGLHLLLVALAQSASLHSASTAYTLQSLRSIGRPFILDLKVYRTLSTPSPSANSSLCSIISCPANPLPLSPSVGGRLFISISIAGM
jgi:hypothetical protein